MTPQERQELKDKLYADIAKAESERIEYELRLANVKAAIQLGIIKK
jgi:hypothetical protein